MSLQVNFIIFNSDLISVFLCVFSGFSKLQYNIEDTGPGNYYESRPNYQTSYHSQQTSNLDSHQETGNAWQTCLPGNEIQMYQEIRGPSIGRSTINNYYQPPHLNCNIVGPSPLPANPNQGPSVIQYDNPSLPLQSPQVTESFLDPSISSSYPTTTNHYDEYWFSHEPPKTKLNIGLIFLI